MSVLFHLIWKRILTLSMGAMTVLDTIPAVPPAIKYSTIFPPSSPFGAINQKIRPNRAGSIVINSAKLSNNYVSRKVSQFPQIVEASKVLDWKSSDIEGGDFFVITIPSRCSRAWSGSQSAP
jgi:hypothetical protein